MVVVILSSFCVVTLSASDVVSALDDVTIGSVDVTECSVVTSSVVEVMTGVVGGVIFPLVVVATDDVIIPIVDVITVVRGLVVEIVTPSVVGTPGVGSVSGRKLYLQKQLNDILIYR